MFELCEHLLDGIEVGAIGRKEQKARAACPDCGPDSGVLVAGEIVHEDDVTSPQRRAKLLFDPGGEPFSVYGLIEDERCIDAVTAQVSDEGHRFPMAIGHLGMQPLAFGRPSTQRRHVGLGPCLVDEDEAPRVRPCLVLLPLLPPASDRGPQLFGRQHAFF